MAQGIAAREHGEVLHDDGIGERAHDLLGGYRGLDQVYDVGLGEYSTLGGHVVQLCIGKAQAGGLGGGQAHLEEALVDGRARARSTFIVHRSDGGLARAASLCVHPLLEDDDLGVLSPQLDHGTDVGI